MPIAIIDRRREVNRSAKAKPRRPVPKSAQVDGSGTVTLVAVTRTLSSTTPTLPGILLVNVRKAEVVDATVISAFATTPDASSLLAKVKV
jgi:hypothetical protein